MRVDAAKAIGTTAVFTISASDGDLQGNRQWRRTQDRTAARATPLFSQENGTGAEVQKLKPIWLRLPNPRDQWAHDSTDDVFRQRRRNIGVKKSSLGSTSVRPTGL